MSHEETSTHSGFPAAPGAGSQGDNKYGFIDKGGKMIIRPQFDEVCPFTDGLAKVSIDGKCGFIDRSGKMTMEPWLDAEENFFDYDMNSFSCDLAKVSVDEKFGYIDRSGKLVIPPVYDDATAFYDGMAFVKKEDVSGFIDKTGEMIISNNSYEIFYGSFIYGLTCITIDGKYGCIDTNGKIVIPPVSEKPLDFFEGMSAVKINGKWGYVDMKGDICIKPAFDEAWSFSEGLAAVMVGGKWGYIDKGGNIVISARFDSLFSSFDGGWAIVEKDSEHLIINVTGEVVFRYGNKSPIGYRGYPQKKLQPAFDTNGNIFLLNALGEVVVQLEDYSPVDSNAFSFKENGRWGLMDYGGNTIIQPVFMGHFDFEEGLAEVEIESGKQGYINMSGQFVIRPQYAVAGSFSEGLAAVCISSVQRKDLSRRESCLKYWICEGAKKLKK